MGGSCAWLRTGSDWHNAGALVSRYLQHTDVSFYTYTALRKCVRAAFARMRG